MFNPSELVPDLVDVGTARIGTIDNIEIGYKGRIGTYELLIVDNKIQAAISEGKSDKEIEKIAIAQNNMLTLSQYGVELVKEHLTTTSELIRVCKLDF